MFNSKEKERIMDKHMPKSRTSLNTPSLKKEEEKECIHLYTTPGIGDALWALFYIFSNSSRNIKLHTLTRSQNYTSPFLKSIKNIISVDNDFSFNPNFNDYFYLCGYSEHMRQFSYYNLNSFDEYKNNRIYMVCNQWVDYGNRLEYYLPNMNLDFKIPWKFELKPSKKESYITIITSATDQNDPKIAPDVSNKWSPLKWASIVQNLKKEFPELGIIWLGNKRDSSILDVINRSLLDGIKIDLDAEQALNLINNGIGHIGYQNGVSHIAVYENIPTYFLTFPRLDKISYAWTPPGIEGDTILYNPVFFDEFNQEHLNNWVQILLQRRKNEIINTKI